MSRWLRLLHRLHRSLGAFLCVLMLSWFASGAVMTFVGFPSYRTQDRLRDSAALPSAVSSLPPQVHSWLSSSAPQSGQTLALVHSATGTRWSFQSDRDGVQTISALPPYDAPAIDERTARAEAERIVGASSRAAVLLDGPDQWTVPLPSALFPLWQVQLDDAQSNTLYIARASGQVVQRTDRTARLWAWLGAIPHWIYPTILRRERTLWKQVVITLAGLSLALSLSGLVIGIDAKRRLWKRRAHAGRSVLRDPYLRWHQRIGLVFGAFVSAWLFSGILSFTPFQWTGSEGEYDSARQRLAGQQALAYPRFILNALLRCQSQLSVHELRYLQVASVPTIICLGKKGESRIVRQHGAELHVAARLADSEIHSIATVLRGNTTGARHHVLEHADSYYYPTHGSPQIARPYWRIDLSDPNETSYYFDPRLAELLQIQTRRLRWSRWLFQGLHSWDFAVLYQWPLLWRSLIVLAMLAGTCLSFTALRMALRRSKRRRRATSKRSHAEKACE